MDNRKLTIAIENKARNGKLISKDTLFSLIEKETNINNKSRIYSVINKLCKDGTISKFNYSMYKVGNVLPSFQEKEIGEYTKLFDKEIISYDVAIWDSSWIAKYSHLLPTRNFIIFECYKYATEHTINLLRSNGIKAIYYKDLDSIFDYLDDRTIFVIKNFNEDSPIYRSKKKKEGVQCTQPKLEKMMVDFVADSFLDRIFSGEIVNIYRTLIENYNVNFSTLIRYATKRNKLDVVDNIIKKANPEIYKTFNL